MLTPHIVSSDELIQTESKPLPTLVFAICNWEPYYSESLPNGGVIVDITRQAFKRSGYNIKIQWLPWARALNLTKNYELDGIIGAWYTRNRAQFF